MRVIKQLNKFSLSKGRLRWDLIKPASTFKENRFLIAEKGKTIVEGKGRQIQTRNKE